MWRITTILSLLILVIGGQVQAQPQPANFTLAVEYGIPGLAAAYAASGVTSVKLRPEFGKWGNIENQPGQFHWDTLDSMVLEYQQAGFTDVQLMLMADSPWASRVPTIGNLPAQRDTFPKEEFIPNYIEFVRQVVERYDHDGLDDLPGLQYPINRYAVEAEFSGFWPGSAEGYLRLLRLAYPTIHAANPQAEVSLVAILAIDVFTGNPGPATIERRFQQNFGGRKTHAEILRILAACDSYDVVDFHSLGNYTEIPLTATWLRQNMAAMGCDAPLIIGDSFSMSGLIGYVFSTFSPATLENRAAVVRWLEPITDPASAEYVTARDWLQAEMARNLVRKAVVSAANQIHGINIGNFEDWNSRVPAADKLGIPAIGTAQFMGMMDTIRTNDFAGGQLPYTNSTFSRINRPDHPRPVFYALQLVNTKISQFTSVNTLDLGSQVWAFEFLTSTGTRYALWFDDGKLYFPGENCPAQTINLPVSAAAVQVTTTPTNQQQRLPSIEAFSVSNGKLRYDLDCTPIFVEAL